MYTGENFIVVRVEDYMGGGGFSASDDLMYLESDKEKTDLKGKWKYKIV
ncbi:MAG: hypothetical protein R2771_10455 [Saprospiraceae bacterium]